MDDYIFITRVGEWLIYSCVECGATIMGININLHTNWHKSLEDRLQVDRDRITDIETGTY